MAILITTQISHHLWSGCVSPPNNSYTYHQTNPNHSNNSTRPTLSLSLSPSLPSSSVRTPIKRLKYNRGNRKKVMSFLLPKLSPPLLRLPNKPNPNPNPPFQSPRPRFSLPARASVQSPTVQGVEVGGPHSRDTKQEQGPGQDRRDDFYLNLGLAVRTLREDMPLIFAKDLNYDIYRDDITFADPLNTFAGIGNYKSMFWALRFHGKILFREISLQVYRIWQPSENMILIRWNLKGIPRVPWEARGEFQGTSRYKLDRNGKIYEHRVDNLAFNLPQTRKPALSVLDLVTACPASPNPTFLFGPAEVQPSSWVEFYRAVRETLERQEQFPIQDGLATCL